MSDIRKRVGSKGTTYQVRYPSTKTKSGYAYATFNTMKEARAFRENLGPQQIGPIDPSVRTVDQAVAKWLDICGKEGRDGRDPVTLYTLKFYEQRADVMRLYPWPKELSDLQTPDVIEFRSWLLRNYTRDQAKKILSSFQSVMKEMATRGHVRSNIAAGISVRSESRYDEPITLPTVGEVMQLLSAADRLANSKNARVAKTWERYRPMLYLAADSGMRPQEYIVVGKSSLCDGAVKVERALERGDVRISVTKTRAGRRTIDLSPDTFDMVKFHADHLAVPNKYDLAFPTSSGRWQSVDNWRKRAFYTVCLEAGLITQSPVNGKKIDKPKYKPYDLRHFYASMLIEKRVNLKKLQTLMGHSDITTTLNTYGHLIEQAEQGSEKVNLLADLSRN